MRLFLHSFIKEINDPKFPYDYLVSIEHFQPVLYVQVLKLLSNNPQISLEEGLTCLFKCKQNESLDI